MTKVRYLAAVAVWLTGCATPGDNIDSFIDVGVKPFNDRIVRAHEVGDTWVDDPRAIINTMFPSPDLTIEYHVEKQRTNAITIVFTREGLYDDSIEGEKRIIELVKSDGLWQFRSIRLGFKCKQGRGQQYYKGTFCR